MTIGWLLHQVLRPVERSLPTSAYMSSGSGHGIVVAFKNRSNNARGLQVRCIRLLSLTHRKEGIKSNVTPTDKAEVVVQLQRH